MSKDEMELSDIKVLKFLKGTITAIQGENNSADVEIRKEGNGEGDGETITRIPFRYLCQPGMQIEDGSGETIVGGAGGTDYYAFGLGDEVIVEWADDGGGGDGGDDSRIIGFTDGLPRCCAINVAAISCKQFIAFVDCATGACWIPSEWNEVLVKNLWESAEGVEPSWIVFELLYFNSSLTRNFAASAMGGPVDYRTNPSIETPTCIAWNPNTNTMELEDNTFEYSGETSWPACGSSSCGSTRDITYNTFNADWGIPILTEGYSCQGLEFYKYVGTSFASGEGAGLVAIGGWPLPANTTIKLFCKDCCFFPDSTLPGTSEYFKVVNGDSWSSRESCHNGGGAGSEYSLSGYESYQRVRGTIWYAYKSKVLDDWKTVEFPELNGGGGGPGLSLPSWASEISGVKSYEAEKEIISFTGAYTVHKSNLTEGYVYGDELNSSWPFIGMYNWEEWFEEFQPFYWLLSSDRITGAVSAHVTLAEGPFADPGGNQEYIKFRWKHEWTYPQYKTTRINARGRGYVKAVTEYKDIKTDTVLRRTEETVEKHGSAEYQHETKRTSTLTIESVYKGGGYERCNTSVTNDWVSDSTADNWDEKIESHKLMGTMVYLTGCHNDANLLVVLEIQSHYTSNWTAYEGAEGPETVWPSSENVYARTAKRPPEIDTEDEWVEGRLTRGEAPWMDKLYAESLAMHPGYKTFAGLAQGCTRYLYRVP